MKIKEVNIKINEDPYSIKPELINPAEIILNEIINTSNNKIRKNIDINKRFTQLLIKLLSTLDNKKLIKILAKHGINNINELKKYEALNYDTTFLREELIKNLSIEVSELSEARTKKDYIDKLKKVLSNLFEEKEPGLAVSVEKINALPYEKTIITKEAGKIYLFEGERVKEKITTKTTRYKLNPTIKIGGIELIGLLNKNKWFNWSSTYLFTINKELIIIEAVSDKPLRIDFSGAWLEIYSLLIQNKELKNLIIAVKLSKAVLKGEQIKQNELKSNDLFKNLKKEVIEELLKNFDEGEYFIDLDKKYLATIKKKPINYVVLKEIKEAPEGNYKLNSEVLKRNKDIKKHNLNIKLKINEKTNVKGGKVYYFTHKNSEQIRKGEYLVTYLTKSGDKIIIRNESEALFTRINLKLINKKELLTKTIINQLKELLKIKPGYLIIRIKGREVIINN